MSDFSNGYRAGLEAAARWHGQDAAALRVSQHRVQRHSQDQVRRLAELHEGAAAVFRAGALSHEGLVSAFNRLTPAQIRTILEPQQA